MWGTLTARGKIAMVAAMLSWPFFVVSLGLSIMGSAEGGCSAKAPGICLYISDGAGIIGLGTILSGILGFAVFVLVSIPHVVGVVIGAAMGRSRILPCGEMRGAASRILVFMVGMALFIATMGLVGYLFRLFACR